MREVRRLKREATATGRTVEEAITAACGMLGADRDNVDFEILELPSKRLLGLLGATEAKVRVTLEETVESRAREFLTGILERMKLENITVDSQETEAGVAFNLTGEGLGLIIGHRGETLDALQYLVSLVANRGRQQYRRITLDTGNYREKREKTLTALARRIALSAVKSRRSTTLEPMNPYERRIIHTAVQGVPGASSWSIGDEPNRRVVIGVENGTREKSPREAH